MTGDGLDDARALLPGTRLERIEVLGGGSDRSVVQRVSSGPDTLIVKAFSGAGEGWVRESAALSVLPPDAPVPRLIAAGAAPPIVVMSDAGTGPSVADGMLGPDPAVATAAVVAWATSLARLHRTTAGSRDAFRAALADRSGDRPVVESLVRDELDDAARSIGRQADALGVDVPAGALDQLQGLATRLGEAGPAALTPADACPDNNVGTADGLVLLDFEGAQWRHIAWDIAYLAVPWPSCWCAWRLPDEVAVQALAAYRAEASLSYVDSEGFGRDLAATVVGWAFMSASRFLPQALLADTSLAVSGQGAPFRRAVILDRFARARNSDELPALAELAERLHDALADRWGDAPLAYPPAYGPSTGDR